MAFKMFIRHRRENFISGVKPIYDRFRSSFPAREAEPGLATRVFNDSKTHWQADARQLCRPSVPVPSLTKVKKIAIQLEHPDPDEADLHLRMPVFSADGFSKTFMFQHDGKTKYNTVLPTKDTKIDAVGVRVLKGIARSRLNLVVRPECTGKPLFHKLLAVNLVLTHKSSSSSGAIIDWKVMSPQLGTEGPESAVIYLSEPLADAKVQHVITVLSGFLHSDLVAITRGPFGLIKITNGIYGCDLPDENTEKEVFNKNTSESSAGWLMSMIICRAGWDAAQDLYHDAMADKKRQERLNMISKNKNERPTWDQAKEEIEELYLRRCLSIVLDELEWQLED